MNPNIADLSEMSDKELEKITFLRDDVGSVYPIIWSSRQKELSPNTRYMDNCPACHTLIRDNAIIFYVEQGFIDGSRNSAEPPIWCVACPECNTYSWVCEDEEDDF